jgi:hypothetical protein
MITSYLPGIFNQNIFWLKPEAWVAKSRNARGKTSEDISRSSLVFLIGFSRFFSFVHLFTKKVKGTYYPVSFLIVDF